MERSDAGLLERAVDVAPAFADALCVLPADGASSPEPGAALALVSAAERALADGARSARAKPGDGRVAHRHHAESGGKNQSSTSSVAISFMQGECWNMVIRTHLSDRGSNRVAPKNDSLKRRRSIGRMAALITLSRISA